MATTEEYINAIKKYVPVSENFETSYFLLAINQARLEIASFFDPQISYYTFSLDSNEVDLTAKTGLTVDQILKVLSVVIVQDNLRYEIPRAFKEFIPYSEITGYPEFYYLNMPTMGFYPKPTSGLSAEVKISVKPDDLSTGDTDTLPEIYKPLVIFLACSHIANMTGNAGLSLYFRDLYENRKGIVMRTLL